jgi:5-methylcytosine-specific restriction enzyme subunit McrC
MPLLNKIYTIIEFDSFIRSEVPHLSYHALPNSTFESLKNFVLNNSSDQNSNGADLFSISIKRGVGEVITAKNYVGLIALKDGTIIEILPKIHYGLGADIGKSKKILLNMLRFLDDISFKNFEISNLKTDKISLFEIFVSMFLQEVVKLTKQGLRSTYIAIDSNESFIKGKINHIQNIKENLVHRERTSLRFDDFNLNRAENRLIKSTLRYLFTIARSDVNRNTIRSLLSLFAEIPYSENYDSDIKSCQENRSVTHYQKSILWCKVFLKGNSFTSYSGSDVAIALLFPMEEVFEKFIGRKMRILCEGDLEVNLQHRKFSLFEEPTKSFYLQPDIILEKANKNIVLDTKWKILDLNSRNFGISQADMYQMYAYGKKYSAERVWLIYPLAKGFEHVEISFNSGDGVIVEVKFVDLLDSDSCINDLLKTAHILT